jgi:thymidylate synthase ThyX
VKLLSHPLDEMKEIGEEIKCSALLVTPTLLKYTYINKYTSETNSAMESFAQNKLMSKALPQAKVELVQHDADAVDRVIAGLLYRYSQQPYKQVIAAVNKMNDAGKEKIIDEALSRMGKHDKPLRELEHASYTFDVLIDYGAFRDIQRHRIATQTNQDFTVENGYSMPPLIVEAGMEKEYRECMMRAESAYREIARDFPKEAQYIIPLAYRKRVLFTMNLREIYHFVKLRSGKTSHYSYKKVAQEMYRLVKEKHPMLAKYMVVDLG